MENAKNKRINYSWVIIAISALMVCVVLGFCNAAEIALLVNRCQRSLITGRAVKASRKRGKQLSGVDIALGLLFFGRPDQVQGNHGYHGCQHDIDGDLNSGKGRANVFGGKGAVANQVDADTGNDKQNSDHHQKGGENNA